MIRDKVSEFPELRAVLIEVPGDVFEMREGSCEAPAHEAGASPIRLSLGPEFGYEPKAPLLSPMPLRRKFQSARPTRTKLRVLDPKALLRFYDSAG
jgi:hypothetical protein